MSHCFQKDSLMTCMNKKFENKAFIYENLIPRRLSQHPCLSRLVFIVCATKQIKYEPCITLGGHKGTRLN